MKKILFVMNPISGTSSKARIPEEIDHTLDKSRFGYELVRTERPGHATELAARAAQAGVDIVVAIGGDGTVNEVGRGLAHTPAAMGIIPCGSGNGLARHLMIPMNVRKAVEIINRDEVHDLDYGVIDGHPFFCTCGMGFDAFISLKFAESGKRGPLTYVEEILRQGLSYKPETYTLEDETGTQHFKAFLISCANASQYGNNAYIAPQASMSDGLMDVIIMEPFDVIEAPRVSYDLFNKTIDKNSRIKTFRCKRLHVERSHEGVIHYDGDPVSSGREIDIHMESRGIRIVVNPDADKTQRRPNAIQTAFAQFFNDIDAARWDVIRQGRKVEALGKVVKKRLNI